MNRVVTTRVALGLGCALLAFGYWAPAFVRPEATGFGDWQMVHHNWEVGRVAVERYGEWPLFDPYHCGGVSMVGNPESQVFAPLFLLSFLVGTTIATKLLLVVHTAVALLGMLLYARRVLDASWPSSLLAGVVFAGSGFFAWHGAGGHATFVSFAFLPLLHLALREGETRLAPMIGAAALLALTIAEGGTYPYPYMLVSLAIATVVRAIASPADGVRSFRALVAITALSIGFAAFRLVPIVATLERLPRTIGSIDSTPLDELWMMLTARDHDWRVPGHEFVWPEYATYVGIPTLLLAGLGVVRGGNRRVRPLVLTQLAMLVAIALLVAGNASRSHPWPLLRMLPVFDSLRVPSRFLVVLTFHVGALAAIGLDAIDPRHLARGKKLAAVVAALLVVGIATDIVVVTRPIVNRWDRPPIDGSSVADARTYRAVPYDAVYASLPARNESTIACYVGGMNWQVAPGLRNGPVPFARALSPEASVELVRQTQSTHRLRYRSERPTRIVLNQNYDPAFRASRGTVVDEAGQLALDLPAGSGTVDVAYGGHDALVGLGATLATVGLVAVVALMLGRRAPTLPPIRIARPALARGGLVVALAAGYASCAFANRPPIVATPSGVFGDDPAFVAEMAIDGRPETEWIPPDGPTASLDLALVRDRDVARIELQNGHNRHYRDRAIRRFAVELYRDGSRIDRIEGEFPELRVPGRRLVLRPRRVARDVDRVRLVVLDSFGLGASLAELELVGE